MLTIAYDHRTSEYAGIQDRVEQTGSFRFTRSLSRDLSLRLGYGYTEARYLANTNYQSHNLDTGVDYSRDLSLTRRTKLSFSTGAAVVRQNQTTRYEAIGSARLGREIGRTWNADLTYQRNVGFLDSVREPTFYDALSAGIGGLITRKVSFRSSVGTTRGVIGITTQPGNGFNAWTGGAGINVALTRNLALGVNYTLYHYNFEENAVLLTGFRPQANRHSVSVTLNAWAPVFQHGKRPHASR